MQLHTSHAHPLTPLHTAHTYTHRPIRTPFHSPVHSQASVGAWIHPFRGFDVKLEPWRASPHPPMRNGHMALLESSWKGGQSWSKQFLGCVASRE